jgi:glycerophosphoryl diester phosphodiesterase
VGNEPTVKVIAHRGLHRGDPAKENTRDAIEAALESSADGLEVDLQQLVDGRFVLHHNDQLDPDRFDVSYPRPLNAMSLEEIREAGGTRILSLEDVFELDWNDKDFVFECKPSRNRYAYVRALLQRLQTLSPPDRFLFSSSDPVLLRQLSQRIGPRSLAPVISRYNPSNRALKESSNWAEYHVRVDLCLTDAFENHEWFPEQTVSWTVNDDSRRRKLERIGIKGIMTDDPSFLP